MTKPTVIRHSHLEGESCNALTCPVASYCARVGRGLPPHRYPHAEELKMEKLLEDLTKRVKVLEERDSG